MKSITARFTALIVVAIILSVAIVGVVSTTTLRDKADNDVVDVINLTCESEAQRINAVLASIEQSVDLEVSYAREGITSTKSFFDDESFRKAYTDEVERLFLDVAYETDGAITFYFRYNAEAIASTQGFLYTRKSDNAEFQQVPLTDISQYSPNDDEHVGWYYKPLRAGKPTWLPPYQNKNLGIYMISYVVPLFRSGQFIGVIGMDVDFSVVVDELRDMRTYEGSGYASLVGQDGTVYYHPQLEYGTHLDGTDASLPDIEAYLNGAGSSGELVSYTYEGKEKRLAYHALANGMDLLLAADAQDINASRNQLIFNLAIAALVIVVVFLAVTLLSGRALLKPLRTLTEVAGEVAHGNLDVEIPRSGSSEVQTLIDAYSTTVARMREQYDIIHEMAHTDSLTGLLNKSSYVEAIAALDEKVTVALPTVGSVASTQTAEGGLAAAQTGEAAHADADVAQMGVVAREGAAAPLAKLTSEAAGEGAFVANMKTSEGVAVPANAAAPAPANAPAAAPAPTFALIMADVNDLKRINDSFGHERGDAYLKNAAALLKGAFGECPVYRIGGDEFVVLAEGNQVARLPEYEDALVARLTQLAEAWDASDKRKPWEYPTIAHGTAHFDPATDRSASDVFARADAAMYARKQSMKA